MLQLIFLLFPLAFFVGMVFLQIFLSKQESRWPGLILPVISLLISLIPVLGFAVYESMIGPGVVTSREYVSGEWVISEQTSPMPDGEVSSVRIPGALGAALYVFFLFNIPTIIYIAVYKVVRNKRKYRSDAETIAD